MKYIQVKLTEDQARLLQTSLNESLEVLEELHDKSFSGVATEQIAFHKRLLTTLAKAKLS